jgi:hypothetical protein
MVRRRDSGEQRFVEETTSLVPKRLGTPTRRVSLSKRKRRGGEMGTHPALTRPRDRHARRDRDSHVPRARAKRLDQRRVRLVRGEERGVST